MSDTSNLQRIAKALKELDEAERLVKIHPVTMAGFETDYMSLYEQKCDAVSVELHHIARRLLSIALNAEAFVNNTNYIGSDEFRALEQAIDEANAS